MTQQKKKGLLFHPDRIRNMCILAHVDHGKTTLSDYLIASNGYVHPKLAGKQRYLDWREEEQKRGITMKSSSIALLHIPRDAKGEPLSDEKFIVNLIDSPGHVDFCSEVSSAARLADGALLVVDAIEGVCVQTHAVIRQALGEKVKLCLVINKLDRLIEELKLSSTEAYVKLLTIIHDVNNVVSGFTSEKYIESQDQQLEYDPSQEIDDETFLFSPSKGNVAFACALEGWAFRLNDFAQMYAKKLSCNPQSLQKALWGPYAYSSKTKKVTKIKPSEAHSKKPMFVQMVLDPIWQSYGILDLEDQAFAGQGGKDCDDSNSAARAAILQLSKKVGVTIEEKEIQRQKEPRKMVQLLLSRWLPLCNSIMEMVIGHLPNSKEGAKERFEALLHVPADKPNKGIDETVAALDFDPEDQEVTAFVSKMIVVPMASLPTEFQEEDEEDEEGPEEKKEKSAYLAFGRVFSGTLKVGQKVHVLSPKYNPNSPCSGERQEGVVKGLFLMKGRDIDALPAAGAGNMVAIAGLSDMIHRSATLSSTEAMYPFTPMTYQSAPILRKAVEPKNPAELHILSEGLKLLYKADPFVEVESSKEGEHIICAAGEVHMESCLKELTESFAKIDIITSPPLVTFKETLRHCSTHKGVKTQNEMCQFVVHTSFIPDSAAQLITDEKDRINQLIKARKKSSDSSDADGSAGVVRKLVSMLKEAATTSGANSNGKSFALERIWSLGPEYMGPNLLCMGSLYLVDEEEGQGQDGQQYSSSGESIGMFGLAEISEKLGVLEESSGCEAEVQITDEGARSIASTLEDGIKSAFQMVSGAGPMCDEALWGVVFTVDVEISRSKLAEYTEGDLSQAFGPLSGQVISAARESLRGAIMASGPRLVEAQLKCEIMTSSAGLSGTYASLGKRHGVVVSEDMREGSDIFMIQAFMPMADSFGFVDELRKRSSGISSATMCFSHWLCNEEEDPYFVPKTEEEREEHGEASGFIPKNRSRRLLDAVRKRKGLLVEEKLVASATKQRTLAKKV